MRKRSLQYALLVIASLGGMAFSFGGWAIVTVDDLPSAFTVGQPATVAFVVRQHGITRLDGLRPTIVATEAARGNDEVTASAIPSGSTGHYVASFVPPRPGNWTVTINSGFRDVGVKLYPIPAVARGTHPAPDAPADVGRRLFAAKGCVGCHVHGALEGYQSVPVGPNLTPKRYQPEYLARFLADPSITRTPGQQFSMPNLALKPSEIAALVAFINKGNAVVGK